MATATRPPRRRQEDRRHEAEQALLDAAARLVALRGIDQTSLADIGAAAGYSRGLANHHFGTKVALAQRLARDSQRAVLESLGDNDGPELEAMVEVARAYLGWVGHSAEAARSFFVLWGAALPAEAVLRPVFAEFDAYFRSRVEDLVGQGQLGAAIRPDLDPSGVAITVVGMLRGIATQYLIDPDGVDLDAAGTACEQFIRSTLIDRGAQ